MGQNPLDTSLNYNSQNYTCYRAFTLTETKKSFRSEKLSEKNGFHSNIQKVTHWSETETETDIASELGSVPIFFRRHFIRSERNINLCQCERTVIRSCDSIHGIERKNCHYL